MPICVGRSKATERPVATLGNQVAVTAVALVGIAKTGILAHRPEPAAVHFPVYTSGIWELSRVFRFAHDREILRALRKEEMP
jgi:hypothetical protein